MGQRPAVTVARLDKTYRLYQRPWDRVWEALSRRPQHRPFRALHNVSFELAPGEGLGVIGENGAGKSTLLKILAGVTAPSAGSVRVEGKLASILELGSGFHPELTGRQNILLNGAMLGLGRDELEARLPAIIAFSELGEFLDQPVKCYSTGMVMRLAFSIATQIEPEVLIVDEALSVGDGYFQKKCMDRLLAFVESGRTLLFCSHAMYYVTAFCRRALWLRQGEIAGFGPAGDVVREYENFLVAKSATPAAPVEPQRRLARIVNVELLGAPAAAPTYDHRGEWGVEVEWETSDPKVAFHLGVGVNRSDGVEVFSCSSHFDRAPAVSGDRRYRARLVVPELPMTKGEFSVYVFLLDDAGLHVYDQAILHRAFQVESGAYVFGLIAAEHRWELDLAGDGERGGAQSSSLTAASGEAPARRA